MRRKGTWNENTVNAKSSLNLGTMRSVARAHQSIMTRITPATVAALVLFTLYLQIINTAYCTLNMGTQPAGTGEHVHDLHHTFLKHRSRDIREVSQLPLISPVQQEIQADVQLANQNEDGAVAATTENVGGIVQVVYTRFMQTQHKLVDLGLARAELFRAFCLPSMVHQTNQNFLWIIRTDPQLDEAIKATMIDLLKPYPHFLLIASNKDTKGFRNVANMTDILTPDNVWSGNVTFAKMYQEASQTSPVLETRLDADDALHLEFFEVMQNTARSALKSNSWMYWCADYHMEWHSGNHTHDSGLFTVRKPRHCVTPGLTQGYSVGVDPTTIKNTAHHKLHAKIKRCREANVNVGKCLKRMDELAPAALRARTISSAGMADIGAVTTRRHNDGIWQDVFDTFHISKDDVVRAKRYFDEHEVAIAADNLKGQCTKGHSCKDRAKEKLKELIQKKDDTVVGAEEALGSLQNDPAVEATLVGAEDELSSSQNDQSIEIE